MWAPLRKLFDPPQLCPKLVTGLLVLENFQTEHLLPFAHIRRFRRNDTCYRKSSSDSIQKSLRLSEGYELLD